MDGTNRDGSFTEVLTCEQQRMLAQAVLDANCEEAQDAAYHEELATWERTLRWAGVLRCSIPVILKYYTLQRRTGA